MAELKRKEEELTTTELASYGIPQKQPDRPKLDRAVAVKSQEPATRGCTDLSLFNDKEKTDEPEYSERN